MKKKHKGSHLKTWRTAQAVIAPNTMHSENGSQNVVKGHMADRNFVHLKLLDIKGIYI